MLTTVKRGGKSCRFQILLINRNIEKLLKKALLLLGLFSSVVINAQTIKGDINEDAVVDVADVTSLIEIILKINPDSGGTSGTNQYPSLLPKVYITTPGNIAINSKVDWVKDGNISIIDERGHESLNLKADFRGRGNSTWLMPKKPYAIKLGKKAEVLGMPKHKRWVLLANWMDRTLLRNAVSFEVARQCLSWTPRGRFVELYVNGEHQGNYYLCEHIKIDENRVDIDEIEENSPFEDITGGYIVEFDVFASSEMNYFYTKYKNYPVTIKEPDEDVIISHEHPAFVYISNYINSVEEAFETGTYEDVAELIDVTSYADWWLVYNLVGNSEPLHPKSCYMYKERDGKLFAGPAWDFDFGTFRPGNKGLNLTKALWYEYLFEYNDFKQLVKERWLLLKDDFDKIIDYIDEQAELIRESNDVNISMWPISSKTNGDEKMSFDKAVIRMTYAYIERIEEIDKAVNGF